MRILFISFFLFFISGCTTIKPTVTEYKLIQKDKERSIISASECKDKTLKISQAIAPVSLNSLSMEYTESKNMVFTYSQARWQDSPANLITMEVLKRVRDAGLFKIVNTSKSNAKSDLVLEIDIEEFMQYYDKKVHSLHVRSAITFNLLKDKDKSIIASRNFSSDIDAKSADASGGVEALSKALNKIMDENIEWLESICR